VALDAFVAASYIVERKRGALVRNTLAAYILFSDVLLCNRNVHKQQNHDEQDQKDEADLDKEVIECS